MQKIGGCSSPTSFVFIDTEVGSEGEVLRSLKSVEGIEEVFVVYGVYDVVAKITANTLEKLKEIVVSRVRQLDNVLSTNTLMIVEKPS